MEVKRWDPEEEGPVDEDELRERLEERGFRVSRHVYRPGTYFSEHTHERDKIDAVISGRFRMTVEGEEVVLEPGDWVEISAGTAHTAEVVGSDPVVSLDATRV